MIENEKELKQKFVQKYIKELTKKTGENEEELFMNGLSCSSFKDNVFITHEDGSTSNYRYAFFIESAECYAVFTEHCGYHEFKKDWLEDIYEYTPNANSEKLVRVKWIGSNTPSISFEGSDETIYPTKRELLNLYNELKDFINYYQEDFTEDKIDYEDELE